MQSFFDTRCRTADTSGKSQSIVTDKNAVILQYNLTTVQRI